MTTEAIEAIEVPEIVTEITQDTVIDPTPDLTEQEAIDAAVEGLRELIEQKYHFCNRWSDMMGERLPAAIKRDQQQRLRYLAAIKVLQGLTWWDGKASEALYSNLTAQRPEERER